MLGKVTLDSRLKCRRRVRDTTILCTGAPGSGGQGSQRVSGWGTLHSPARGPSPRLLAWSESVEWAGPCKVATVTSPAGSSKTLRPHCPGRSRANGRTQSLSLAPYKMHPRAWELSPGTVGRRWSTLPPFYIWGNQGSGRRSH